MSPFPQAVLRSLAEVLLATAGDAVTDSLTAALHRLRDGHVMLQELPQVGHVVLPHVTDSLTAALHRLRDGHVMLQELPQVGHVVLR